MPREHTILDPSTSEFDDFQKWYEAAQALLARGRKGAGLEVLLELYNILYKTPAKDENMLQLKASINRTVAFWCEGFNGWDVY